MCNAGLAHQVGVLLFRWATDDQSSKKINQGSTEWSRYSKLARRDLVIR
jgi:hypothetical protein